MTDTGRPEPQRLAKRLCSCKQAYVPDEAELRDFLATRLAPFKQPTVYWQAHEALPRLGTQKIDKRGLREKYTQEYLAA